MLYKDLNLDTMVLHLVNDSCSVFVVQSLGQITDVSFFFHILFCYKIFLEFLEEMFIVIN